MPLLSVSLLLSLQVEAFDQPDPIRGPAIHVLFATGQEGVRAASWC